MWGRSSSSPGCCSAAIGGDAYALMQAFFGFWLGQLILFGYTWSLIHHMLGGVRHFVWDTGNGLDHPQREWMVAADLAGSVLLTLAPLVDLRVVPMSAPIDLKTIATPTTHYGSPKASTRSFKMQRLTGALNIAFLAFLVWLVVTLAPR